MAEIHFDSPLGESERRDRLYAGGVFVFRPTAATRAFCDFTDELIREAFDGRDPRTAQHEIPVEEMVALLKDLKPRFIHHEESKDHLGRILDEFGCDPDDTHYDVPRLRSSTSDGYLTTGIAYAWHPHRDTWYSAPQAQINWWMPVYPISEGDGMCFYFEDFQRAVPNDSDGYDYKVWNERHRFAAADQVRRETRPLPGPLGPIDPAKATPVVIPVGSLILFSGAQLHASVPNHTGRTRYSIDFRTVSLEDCRLRRGAPDVDAACTWSSIRDFKRRRDRAEFPDDLATVLEQDPRGTETAGRPLVPRKQ